MNASLMQDIEQKIDQQQRLSSEDGLYLLTDAPLIWLGHLADQNRRKRFPNNEVTFVIDSNPNYTNICDTDCTFCAFYRRPSDPDSYTLTVEDVLKKIARVAKLGVTTVLLQGGHNRTLKLDYYLSLIRETKRKFPQITPHFFTASEIQTMAEVEGIGVPKVLEELKNAGQDTLPGGGAEILSERIRRKVSPKKGGPEKWLSVHRAAHELGFVSTATMMYGYLEEPEDILEHWNAIRGLQDASLSRQNGGKFTAFVPWSFKPDHTALERRFPKRAGPMEYLRMLAVSRLYLDNFEHIQASWFSEGKKVGQAALHFGADDFGGTLYEENVHAEAGFVNVTTLKEVTDLIHESGFHAVQRDTRYHPLNHYPKGKSPERKSEEVSLRKNVPLFS